MADPKGISFGGNNLGLATVLPDSNPAALVAMEEQRKAQAAALKAKQEAERSKRKQNTYKQLTDLESADVLWMEGFQKEKVAPLIDEVAKLYEEGRDDEAEIAMARGVNSLNNYATSTHQAAELISAEKESIFKNDLLTQDGKENIYRSSVLETVTDENGKVVDPQNITGFEQKIFDEGASVNYDTGKVIKSALDNADFQEKAITIQDGDPGIKNLGNGFVRVGGKKISMSALPYINIDQETGQFNVKPPAELLEEGIVDNLMNDPYMARYIDDQVLAKNPNVLSDDMDMARAEIVNETLQGYKGGGKFEKVDTSKTMAKRAVTNISVGAQKSKDLEDKSKTWLQDLRSGDYETSLNAAGYLAGARWTDGSIIKDVYIVQAGDKKGFIRLNLIDDKGTSKKVGSTTDFNNMTGEITSTPKYQTLKRTESDVFIDPSNKADQDKLLNMYAIALENAEGRHYGGLPFNVDEGDIFDITNFE